MMTFGYSARMWKGSFFIHLCACAAVSMEIHAKRSASDCCTTGSYPTMHLLTSSKLCAPYIHMQQHPACASHCGYTPRVVLTHTRQTNLLIDVCISLADPLITPPIAHQMSTVASTVRAGARDPSGTYVRAPQFHKQQRCVRTRMRPRSVHVTYINCITDLPCAISMIDICVVCIQCSRWHAPFTCMARCVMIDSFTAHTRHQPCDRLRLDEPLDACCVLLAPWPFCMLFLD
jgi:hypothetical protein